MKARIPLGWEAHGTRDNSRCKGQHIQTGGGGRGHSKEIMPEPRVRRPKWPEGPWSPVGHNPRSTHVEKSRYRQETSSILEKVVIKLCHPGLCL